MGNKSAKRTSGFLGTSALTRPLFALGAATALFGAGPAHAIDANTLPQNPNVVGGKDSFAQSGNTLNVNQSTKRTVIDWRSFDIGSKAQVNFNQPGTSAIAVNRVNSSANPTQIEGGLHANGQVWILNPNGVFFGKTAHVDAAGIVASTANIDTNAFMAGSNKLQMTGADHGAVENQGNISVGQAGLAAFVAPSVRNSGTINATVGKVALAAGTTYTLDLAGDHLVELGLGSVKAVVDNSGKIVNPGGTIALTAKAASQVVSSVVNVSGTVSASSVSTSGGTITLGGDNVTTTSTAQLSADAGTNGNGGTITSVANVQGNYAGSFSAKGGSQSGNGGSVETSGKSVTVADGISVDTRASSGILGNWTVDPININIVTGGDDGDTTGADGSITVGSIENALNSTSLTISTEQGTGGDGDISLQSSISATGPGSLTLTGRHLYETGGSTISLAGALTLNVNAVNNTSTPSGTWIGDALGMIGTVTGGTTVNVGAGTYNENVTINKSNVALLSTDGSASTKIIGQGSAGFIGAVTVKAGGDNFTLGSIGHGFTVVGINGPAGNESAAVYFTAANSGSKIQGNTITANGDEGLLTNSGVAITGLTVDTNIFNGQTFTGANPAGQGFSQQFSLDNVPRQLVVISGGNGGGNTSNITFTNNQITGTAGGLNTSGQEQGNSLVTIDAHGATITGNTFAGTTTTFAGTLQKDTADALRARGTDTVISGNTFDGTNMGSSTNMLYVNDSALPSDSSFSSVVAANIFKNGAVWFNSAVAGVDTVFRGIQTALANVGAGDTVSVGVGTYSAGTGITIGTDGITLQGVDGAKITASGTSNLDAITINSDNVTVKDLEIDLDPTGSNSINGVVIAGSADDATVSGLTIRGEVATTGNGYIDYAFGGANSRGIVVKSDASGFSITGNDIRNVRTGILVDGALVNTGIPGASTNSGDITDNLIDNTKGALLINYSQGAGINISGNHQATYGNEWGEIWDLQGAHTGAASDSVQAALLAASVANNGWTVEDQAYASSNRTAVTVAATATNANGNPADSNQGSYRSPLATIQAGVNAVVAGGTVNVLGGDYTMAGQLTISKSLSLVGAGVGVTNITSNSTGYGIYVTADDVSLSGFTYNAPTAVGATYGIKVEPGTNVASDRVTGFNIDHVTINGGYRTGLDLNGVDGATIDNVSVSNVVYGNGIGLTDSANVTLTNDTTANNAWGGLALYQTNTYYDQQVNNIVVDGTNTFNDTIPVYTEDQSASQNFGSISLAGFSYVVQSPNAANDVYSWFQKTKQAAFDFATNASLSNGNVNVPTATVQGYGGSGAYGNNVFYVGTGSNSDAMSIDNAVDQATTGGTVNVDAGTYAEDVAVGTQLSFNFGGSGVTVNSLTVGSGGAGSSLNGNLTATGAIALNGATTMNGNLKAASFASNATLAMTGNLTASGAASLGGASTVKGNVQAASFTSNSTLALTGNLSTSGAAALNGASSVTGNVSADSLTTGSTLALVGDITATNGVTLGGASTVTGNISAASLTASNTLGLTGNLTTSGASALNGAATITGNVQAGSITAGSSFGLTGNATATGAIALNGANTLAGTLTGGSIALGATTLTGSTSLNTSGSNGAIQVASVDGGQALSLNAGTGTISLGNVGATTALASLTDASATTLTGATYNAGSFLFGGDVTLTGSTTLNASTIQVASVTGASNDLTLNGASSLGDVSGVDALALNGAATITGNVQAGSITAANSFGLTGNATATGAIALNGANTLAGTLTGGSIALGATTLAGSTSLNTSGSNGAIQVASVDGGQTLGLNAGTGTISLGNVGATTALASLTDASATTLTGATYNAGSFLFGGDVTLTAATTTLSTGGGDITFTGDIFGTADSAQSLTLNAGPGTGSPSANGNITLDNAGTSAVWLGDVTVSGNNFTANTVYVGGNYTSTLTGNQVFAADTLHTRGNVDSTVGGDASGHIDAAGDVNISAGGDVSGTIGGNNVTLTGDDVNANVTAQSNASVTGNTVEGNYAANTVGIVAQNNVNAAVNATNFQLVAASGSVNGTWTNYTVGGSGTVYLNGDPQIGVNPSQLVVEGFTLPAGTTIGANGQLILPQGVLLGLLSPGGGKPKMILVHTVQELGQLLADGYSVIVIDLSGNDKDKPIQLASN